MRSLLIVALGGGLGSVGRYLLSGVVLNRALNWQFPMGTLAVNVLGCLVVGVMGGLVVKLNLFSADVRLFWFTGLIGGFTTFSAFGLETLYLLRKGELGIAATYVVLSVLVGLLAVWLGFGLVSKTPA